MAQKPAAGVTDSPQTDSPQSSARRNCARRTPLAWRPVVCETGAMPVVDVEGAIENRIEAIRAAHASTAIARAELDVSGGIDSGVMLGLLARAIGPERITAVFSSIHSGPEFRARARDVAGAFGVRLVEIDLSGFFDQLVTDMRGALVQAGLPEAELDERCRRDPTVLGSIRSCMRAVLGRGFNRLSGGGLRHGTGNECEDRFLRFYQKGGDGEVDSNPIAMLSKGEVYQVARGLGVPRSLIDAVPSPDLHAIGDDHTDEEELKAMTGAPWTYSRVDADTGAYARVGTIERMSRFLDLEMDLPQGRRRVDVALFDDGADEVRVAAIVRAAQGVGPFVGVPPDVTSALVRSARRIESITRHKMNPNCPTYGTRAQLVDAGLLTDTLPLA